MPYRYEDHVDIKLHSKKIIYYINLAAQRVVEHFKYEQDHVFSTKADFATFLRDNINRSITLADAKRVMWHFVNQDMIKFLDEKKEKGLQLINFSKWEGEENV